MERRENKKNNKKNNSNVCVILSFPLFRCLKFKMASPRATNIKRQPVAAAIRDTTTKEEDRREDTRERKPIHTTV